MTERCPQCRLSFYCLVLCCICTFTN
jgi:hypothetical protein